MKFSFICILSGLLFAGAFAGTEDLAKWIADEKLSEEQLQKNDGVIRAVPQKKRIHVYSRKTSKTYPGMKITMTAEFSGEGKVVAGFHCYDSKNKWLGAVPGISADIKSPNAKKCEGKIVIENKNAVTFRPYIHFLSGDVSCRSLEWKWDIKEISGKEALEKVPNFRNWSFSVGSGAVSVSLAGSGEAEDSMISVETTPIHWMGLYAKKPEKAKDGDFFRIRFESSGMGKFQVGLHLYDKQNTWLGFISSPAEGMKPGERDELTFEMQTPPGKKQIAFVRPGIRIFGGSDLKVGKIRLNKRNFSVEKPEVEIPLPDGYQLIWREKADFPIRFFASENRIVLDQVEKPYDNCADNVASLRVSAISSDNRKIGEAVFHFEKGLIENRSLGIEKNFTGSFVIRGEYLDKNGAVLTTGKGFSSVSHLDLYSGKYISGGIHLTNAHLKNWVRPYPMGQVTFHREHHPFEKSDFGTHGFPGFSPIEIKGNEMILSGRKYLIGNDGFPEQISALQQEPTVGNATEEILGSPARLAVDGKTLSWKRGPFRKENHSVKWTQSATGAGAEWQIENCLDPDGVLRMELNVKPGNDFRPEKVSLILPVKREQATLYQNITDVTYRRLDRTKKLGQTPLGGFAGFTPEKKIRGDIVWESKGQERKSPGSFQPYLWLGNEDRGICYFSDSDRGWSVDDSLSALEISRSENLVSLNINFVNTPAKKITEPGKWIVGLLATPVKPPFKNWRGTIFPRWMTMDKNFYSGLQSVRKLIVVSAGHPVFNSGTQSIGPQNLERTKKAYSGVRDEKGSTYLEYFCSDELNLNIPEIKTYFSEWSCAAEGSGPQARSRRWQSKSYDFASATTVDMQRISSSYLKYRSWAIGEKLKNVGLFSFYEDNLHTRTCCDPHRNLGFKDEKGRPHPEYDLWSLRGYFHSLAEKYQRAGFENLSGAHGSASLLIPALAGCAFFIDGEQPGRYDNSNDKDYIDHWRDLDYMRAVSMGRAFGINTIFLSEMTFPGKDEDGHHTRAWLALILPHDIAPWDGAVKNRASVRAWHKIVNDLNFYNDPPRLYPYWAQGPYKVFEHEHQDLLVTVWKQKKRTVVMLSNLGKEGTFHVKLLPEKIGAKPFKALKNLESGEVVSGKGNEFSVKIPYHDFAVFSAEE